MPLSSTAAIAAFFTSTVSISFSSSCSSMRGLASRTDNFFLSDGRLFTIFWNFPSTSCTDASAEGVQRDLLPIIEGSTVNTKYGNVVTDHILFIASGAFHHVKPSNLLAELQGRRIK